MPKTTSLRKAGSNRDTPFMQKPDWLRCTALLLITLTLPLNGCTPSEQQKVESTRLEVIAIHDEAMAMMGPMYELEMALTSLLEKRKKSHQPTDDQQAAITGLIMAQEAMMDWMRRYKPPDKGSSTQEAMAYFRIQKAQIIEVRRMTDEAISTAEVLLDAQP